MRGRVAAAAVAVALGACAREAGPPPAPAVDVDAALEQAAGARASGTAAGRARADSLYRAVLRADAEQAEARFAVGVLAAEAGDLWAAQWHLVRLLRTRPEHAGGLSLLGLAAYSQGRLDDAVPLLERLGAQRALTFEESVALADACNKRSRFALAESVFAAVVERFPGLDDANGSRVLEGLGYARWKQGRLDEAVADLGRAAALAPDATPTRLMLATVLADLDRVAEAAAALPELSFEEAQRAGTVADYFVLKNRLRLRAGDRAEIAAGARELERVAAAAPDQVKVPHLLVQMRRRLGDLDGARAAADLHAATIHAVDRRDDARAEQDLLDGAALEGDGDPEGALEAYGRGLEIAPDNPHLLCAAGSALSRLDRRDEARAAFARLRALPGGDSPGRLLIAAGEELRRRGLPAAAASRFELAAARLPGQDEPAFLQALALSEAGRWEEALRIGASLDRPAGAPSP